jgi:hypothetical protein
MKITKKYKIIFNRLSQRVEMKKLFLWTIQLTKIIEWINKKKTCGLKLDIQDKGRNQL